LRRNNRKNFVEEIELKAVFASATSVYFSERLVEQRIPSTQDSLVFQVRTSPGFYSEAHPSNAIKIVWGNTLKACSTPPNINYSNLNAISIAANDTIQSITKTYLPNNPLNEIFKVGYKNRYVDLVEFKRLTTRRTRIYKDREVFSGEYYLMLNDSIATI
jgi:hypothetical protein